MPCPYHRQRTSCRTKGVFPIRFQPQASLRKAFADRLLHPVQSVDLVLPYVSLPLQHVRSSSSWYIAAARDPHCSSRYQTLHLFRIGERLTGYRAERDLEADEEAKDGPSVRLRRRANDREYRYSLRG